MRLRICMFLLTGVVLLIGERESAAIVCVNQNPKSGCFATIGAAVAAAAAGDTIQVAAGRYTEDVHILRSVYLVGAGAQSTTIDAKGLANGIFIDGIGSSSLITPGANTLANITVSGFTVRNANFEGILVANASNVTLWANHVTNNNRVLTISGMNISCPNIPDFETNEGLDCGEGIHLSGVDHSTVAGTTIDKTRAGFCLATTRARPMQMSSRTTRSAITHSIAGLP